MLSAEPIVLPQAAVEEAKTYLRIVGADEDALVARLMRSAAELCEQFTGQRLVAREFSDVLPASAAWTRLGASPVRAISGVEALPVSGTGTPIPASDYALDIDANGDGWVRMIQAGGDKRVRASFDAGLAAEWTDLPDALRQGVVRLAAHFYTHRDAAADAAPPAAVTALWRPWRRMRLG
jgi:uncharacterized phiE125 gp8 family phage protein